MRNGPADVENKTPRSQQLVEGGKTSSAAHQCRSTLYDYGREAKATKIGEKYGKLSIAVQELVRDRRKLFCGLSSPWCPEAACVVLPAPSLYAPWVWV